MQLLFHTQRVLSFSSLLLKHQCHTTRLSISTTASQFVKQLFDLNLEDGRCVGLELDVATEDETLEDWSNPSHWVHSCLHPDEISYGKDQTRAVRKSFLLGRLAMRASLPMDDVACLKDDHGRPTLPVSHLGSISHTGNIGVALTAPAASRASIGIDIEKHASNKRSIAPKVLTKREIQELGRLENVSGDEEVLLRFSLKEAVYKAIHPLLNQYVGFQEAEVTPHDDGTATVRWNLDSGAHTKLDHVQAHWQKLDGYFLSSSTCSLKEG